MTLSDRYRRIRSETERLADPLTAEDQGVQSMPDASPAKWHRAHTTWFFETFVLFRAPGYRIFDERNAFLFNSYYEGIGPRIDRSTRGVLSRPGIQDVFDYRAHVDAAMLDFLDRNVAEPDMAFIVELGLQHEQQHQELLLTDILHAFAQNPFFPAYAPYVAAPVGVPASPNLVTFEGGVVEVGNRNDGFAFDNETPVHEVLLGPFRLSDRLTTNREWLEFMRADGYRSPQHWLSDGWARAREERWQAPLYWHRIGDEWHTMTLSGLIPLDLDAPVSHVSYYEADAFARWRGKRLPLESEWEHAALSDAQGAQQGNFRESGHLRPVAAVGGSRQLFGDVWEWTQSPYMPYPGFKPVEGAVGEYNGKFMINQMVLRGGSCVTGADHIRATYRNFFYPHQRWQFSGVRLADDIPKRRTHARRAIPPFLKDTWSGMSSQPKTLPSKYFYDAEGSRLFEAICALPEYYLTRSEAALLRVVSRDLASEIAADTALVEFGCGDCAKTRVLLDRLPAIARYVPIDICEDSLRRSIAPLVATFPRIAVQPLAGDFGQDITLPDVVMRGPRLGFFSGSTIGNFEMGEAIAFLGRARASLGSDGKFLVAIDLVKDKETLLAAYDDAQGVTAQFNKNLLARINRELDSDFDLANFSHLAVWNADMSRIEMHLSAREEQNVRIAGRAFRLERGETIHTENSHKYSLESFSDIAREAGWNVLRSWKCPPPEFALVLLG